MKNALFFVLLLIISPLKSTNYYFANNGDDVLNTGLSSSSPWQTFAPLGLINLSAGDTVFLRSGDMFRGTLSINDSGTVASPIVITSYGNLAKPIISGAQSVTNWTQHGNYWTAPLADSVTHFFIDDREMIPAREPNEANYFWLDSATVNEIWDNNLNSYLPNYWDTAQICIHTAQWCWEFTGVSNFSPGHVTFTDTTIRDPQNRYGYFFYDMLSLLDTAHEWKYDAPNDLLYYYAETLENPNNETCEYSTYAYGIRLYAGARNVRIVNVAFEKQTESGVFMAGTNQRNITIQDCDFARQFWHGVFVSGKNHEISNCTFTEIDGHGIDVNNYGHTHIHHNSFHRVGMFRNGGIGGETNLSAIALNFADSCTIDHNVIDSTGYCGISADGKYNIIERNIIMYAMLLNNDGAALKSYGAGSQFNIFRNNFVSESGGNTEGTFNGQFLTPGIYFDFSVNYCEIRNNTIYNQPSKGIFQNSGTHHNTIRSNVVYGTEECLDINGNPITGDSIVHDVITRNVFFALTPSAFLVRELDYSETYTPGVIDSNYCFHPYNSVQQFYRVDPNTGNPIVYDFAGWQGLGYDLNSTESFVSWIYPANESRLIMNQSDSLVYYNLGDTLYLSLDSVLLCGYIPVQPYTSQVIINTGSTCIPTSVEANESLQFSVAPNPASEYFMVFGLPPDNYTITVYNYSGELVHVQENYNIIRTDNWATGIYTVVVTCGDSIATERVIINR